MLLLLICILGLFVPSESLCEFHLGSNADVPCNQDANYEQYSANQIFSPSQIQNKFTFGFWYQSKQTSQYIGIWHELYRYTLHFPIADDSALEFPNTRWATALFGNLGTKTLHICWAKLWAMYDCDQQAFPVFQNDEEWHFFYISIDDQKGNQRIVFFRPNDLLILTFDKQFATGFDLANGYITFGGHMALYNRGCGMYENIFMFNGYSENWAQFLSLTNGNWGPSFDFNQYKNMDFFDRDPTKQRGDSSFYFDVDADGAIFDEEKYFEIVFDQFSDQRITYSFNIKGNFDFSIGGCTEKYLFAMAQDGTTRLGYLVDSTSKLLKFEINGNLVPSTVTIAEQVLIDLTILVFNYETALLFAIYQDDQHLETITQSYVANFNNINKYFVGNKDGCSMTGTVRYVDFHSTPGPILQGSECSSTECEILKVAPNHQKCLKAKYLALCDPGYFKHTQSQICVQCSQNCEECDGYSQIDCTKCDDELYLSDRRCLFECKPQQYLVENNRCQDCEIEDCGSYPQDSKCNAFSFLRNLEFECDKQLKPDHNYRISDILQTFNNQFSIGMYFRPNTDLQKKLASPNGFEQFIEFFRITEAGVADYVLSDGDGSQQYRRSRKFLMSYSEREQNRFWFYGYDQIQNNLVTRKFYANSLVQDEEYYIFMSYGQFNGTYISIYKVSDSSLEEMVEENIKINIQENDEIYIGGIQKYYPPCGIMKQFTISNEFSSDWFVYAVAEESNGISLLFEIKEIKDNQLVEKYSEALKGEIKIITALSQNLIHAYKGLILNGLTLQIAHDEFVGSNSINIQAVCHFTNYDDSNNICEDIHLLSYINHENTEVFRIEAQKSDNQLKFIRNSEIELLGFKLQNDSFNELTVSISSRSNLIVYVLIFNGDVNTAKQFYYTGESNEPVSAQNKVVLGENECQNIQLYLRTLQISNGFGTIKKGSECNLESQCDIISQTPNGQNCLKPNIQNVCQESFIDPIYIDECIKCPEKCQQCDTDLVCTECMDGFYMFEQECFEVCPEEDYMEFDSNKTCLYNPGESGVQEIPLIQQLPEEFSQASQAVVYAAGPMMLLGADPTMMWSLALLMQTIYYMLFFNVEYPDNVKSFFKIFSAGRLDFLNYPLENGIFTFYDEENLLDSPKNFRDNEFSGTFLQSGSIFVVLWMTVLATYSIVKLLNLATKNCQQGKLKSFVQKCVSTFEWSLFFRVYFISSFELNFAAILQIVVFSTSNTINTISSILGVVVAILNAVSPIILYVIIQKIEPDQESKKKYEPLLEDYDINHKYRKQYSVFTVQRRLIHSMFMVLLYNQRILQILSIWLPNFIMLVVIATLKPHMNLKMNFFDFFMELGFLAIHSMIFVLGWDQESEIIKDSEQRDMIGLLIIIICLIIVAAEIILLLRETYSTLKDNCKKLKIVIAGKQRVQLKVNKSPIYLKGENIIKKSSLTQNTRIRNLKGKKKISISQNTKKQTKVNNFVQLQKIKNRNNVK